MHFRSFARFAIFSLSTACLAFGIGSTVLAQHHGHRAAAPTFKQVDSVMKANCLGCHNENRHPEKVDVSSYHALMHSGENGPIVIARHPEKSDLVKYIDGESSPRMPFKKGPLPQKDIDAVKAWIKAGAKDN